MSEPVTSNRDMSEAEEALRLAGDVADRVVAEARQKAGEIAAEARTKAEEVVAASRSEAVAMMQEARVTAEREAREKHHEVMESLADARKELEAQVAKLRSFEREYRTHLLEYLEGQMAVFKAGVFNRESPPR
jgi:vacuolar-type H+-ATPase subunit H